LMKPPSSPTLPGPSKYNLHSKLKSNPTLLTSVEGGLGQHLEMEPKPVKDKNHLFPSIKIKKTHRFVLVNNNIFLVPFEKIKF
jgi:hypothetical protein